ncbi:MAG: hypothetical protein ABII00_00820 [Elusimicrobiota bacterium]
MREAAWPAPRRGGVHSWLRVAGRAARGLGLLVLFLEMGRGGAPAQQVADGPAYESLSNQMRLAIDLYGKERDMEAMDRFMEILVQGSAAERTMANEYLNLITQRMAGGGKVDRKPPVGAAAVSASPPGAPRPDAAGEEEPAAPVRRPAEPEPREVEERPALAESRLSRSDRDLMKKEIDDKIRNRTRVLLGQLRRYEDIVVHMANSQLPRAIGIPSSVLFDSGTRFVKGSGKILDILGDLVFGLGATQVVILPESALLGESKILDMRRTMGISAHLTKAGLAPARVRVNLLSTQVDVPQQVRDFKGVLLIFVYNQPMKLSSEDEVGAESGPPLSLGVSPGSLDPKKGEGVIIEFSVVEPPTGLMSWRFQLLGPGERAGDDLVVLQEVKGSAPVYHQIYWNGRKRYFGKELPAGRYECLLTATDLKNRTRKKRAWIAVEGKPSRIASKPETKPESGPGPEPGAVRPQVGRKIVTESSPAPKLRSVEIGKEAPRRRRSRRRPRRAQKKVAAKTLSSPPAAAQAEGKEPAASARRATVTNYQVVFVRNTSNVTSEGELVIERVDEVRRMYPLARAELVGYANTGEPNPESLARDRARLVSDRLEDRGMKTNRIDIRTQIVEFEAAKVEIYIAAGKQ